MMDNATISIIELSLNSYTGEICLAGYWLYAIILIILIIAISHCLFRKRYQKKSQTFEFSFAGQKYSYTLERDYSNVEIAHRVYVELITRKAAIPFDEENDIIIDVYNSWYSLFGIIREEIKAINGKTLLLDKKSLPLIELTIAILNKALRPHLTKHQGRFRKWWKESDQGAESPQQHQKLYPNYEILVSDLIAVNRILVDYARQLKEFIHN